MNVFEDLIEELKEENLLETTVIETSKIESYYDNHPPQTSHIPPTNTQKSTVDTENSSLILTNKVDSVVDPMPSPTSESFSGIHSENIENDGFEIPTESAVLQKMDLEQPAVEPEQVVANLNAEPLKFSDQIIQAEAELKALDDSTPKINQETAVKDSIHKTNPEQEQPEFPEYELLAKKVVEDSEFYRRRANEEVTSLQIVEHIITAIEKEQLKIIPHSYDDLAVSMALHDFLQAGSNPLSDEHTQAEYKLMQETEKWYSALAGRDKNIGVADLRRYCENARPALSSQALISLSRFYRNSPFSETVRSKFDMVITRLVTKESWDDTRLLIFNRDELIKQLEELYADWSSIPLYENKEDDSDVLIGVLKFEDFILEVNKAESLDELVRSDFFNRVRTFKETTGEKFFAPLLVSAAVECNVIMGNRYVQLIDLERENHKEAEIEEKYNYILDQPVSDTVSKTLKLIELLKEKKEPPKPVVVEQPKEIKEEIVFHKSSKEINHQIEKKRKQPKFRINKWMAALVVLALFGLGGLYTWAEYMTPQIKPSPNVRKIILDDTPLREYFKTARVSRETYFAVTEPAWDKLSREIKTDVLKKMLAEGKVNGYSRIHVLDSEGKTIAFASEKGIELELN